MRCRSGCAHEGPVAGGGSGGASTIVRSYVFDWMDERAASRCHGDRGSDLWIPRLPTSGGLPQLSGGRSRYCDRGDHNPVPVAVSR